jgi:hypothetical protein
LFAGFTATVSMQISRIAIALSILLSATTLWAASDTAIDFNRDIRPILSNNCYACHGPDKGARKADLRLDTHDGLYGKIDDVFPVVPGKIDDSQIYLRITSNDDEFRMPRPSSGKVLTPRQVATIKQWIVQGAPWKDHWSYELPVKVPPPAVTDSSQPPGNPIDGFVLASLRTNGLSPAPQADRINLMRRLSQDLVGLPPSTRELDAFISDSSASAYDSLVDRLLASPHFGERMAVYWLDLVRYADTIGYHSDNARAISPYRDYVINSFNNNKPFDQFTVEQLAGDLLPEPTTEQKIASGYNRLLETTTEGGAQAKEYIAKYAADRVRNVSSVWLAATMGCCQCHDHKFDPYWSRDFYQLAAFFADIQEPAIALPQPELLLPDETQKARLADFDARLAAQREKLQKSTPELAAAQQEWEKSLGVRQSVQWKVLTPVSAVASNGTVLNIADDGAIVAGGNSPDKDTYTITVQTDLAPITAIRLEALAQPGLPGNGPGRAPNGNIVLTEFSVRRRDAASTTQPGAAAATMPSTQPTIAVPLQNATASFEQPNAQNPARHLASSSLNPGKPGLVGWALLGGLGRDQYAVFETASDVGDGSLTTLVITLRQDYGERHTLGKFRLSATSNSRPVRAAPSVPKEIQAIRSIDPQKRTPAQNDAIAAYYRGIAPLLAPVRDQIAAIEKQKAEFVATVRKTLISVAGRPREIRVLPRGDWQNDSGPVVLPAVPHFLKQLNVGDRRATRLDLARWIVARDNPLAARVFVNRLWKLFFGQGIARTLDDFGSQGQWPTHPELLDWLACEFMDSGWDVKHMIRLIVTSQAYRRVSEPTAEMRDRDAFNFWLARQGRFRLDAEFVRDNALAISGLLNDEIGGESVKPYQPAGYWDFLNFPKRTYEPDHGAKQYRRGLYTWWQRTFLHPALVAFDATGHEECVAERARSNTPQQALVLLNDPTFVEAARVFAQRILTEAQGDDRAKLAWAIRQALARAPQEGEEKILLHMLAKHRLEYVAHPDDARKLIATGESLAPNNLAAPELAAWTNVARAILNLHETITRS